MGKGCGCGETKKEEKEKKEEETCGGCGKPVDKCECE